MKNTKQEGQFRVFFYPYKKAVVGVCPEFGMIYKGNDLYSMKKEMFETINEYLNVVREKNIDDKELNKSVSLRHYLYFYWFSIVSSITKTCNFNESWTGGRLKVC